MDVFVFVGYVLGCSVVLLISSSVGTARPPFPDLDIRIGCDGGGVPRLERVGVGDRPPPVAFAPAPI